MRAYVYITTLVILAFSVSCNNYKRNSRQNDIKRIVFATGGCFGTCPIQAIDMDSSLTIRYHGIRYTDSIGFYTGITSIEFWDSLNIKFEGMNYSKLDSSYEQSVDDLSTEIYIFYNDNKIKHIYGQSASLPDSVMSVYKWLMKSIEQMKFTKVKDSLSFPTIIEKPLPIPPPPKNIDIKYTPLKSSS
jgi:hypothetical protein